MYNTNIMLILAFWSELNRTAATDLKEDDSLIPLQFIPKYNGEKIEGFRERTEYIQQLWNWENHS